MKNRQKKEVKIVISWKIFVKRNELEVHKFDISDLKLIILNDSIQLNFQ